jgi:glycerophosphoryl diester phosphodiesterase
LNPNRFRSWYTSGATGLLILAHRGDSFRAPENTLEAARLGHASGADGWELDVRLTRDGVPIVLHDESLLRTTDVARRFEGDPRTRSGFLVGDFLLEEIRSLDAGSWFVDPSGGSRSAAGFGSGDRIGPVDRLHYESGRVRVPTLAEALELTAGLDWMVNVEIKPSAVDPSTVVGAVLRAIRVSGTRDRVTVSSFDHEIVRLVGSLEPRVATGALVTGSIGRPAGEILGSLGADALHAPVEAILGSGEASSTTIEIDSRPGVVPILVYTVNETGPSGPASRLAGIGVSGVFTDDPASFCRTSNISRSGGRTRSHSDIAVHPGDDPSDGPIPPLSRPGSSPETR